MIYLDNSATTFPKPKEVYDALDYANRNLAFNGGRGTYDEANKVSQIINETRAKIASFVNVQPNKVVFLSSATESLNMIINGIDFQEGDNVYISPFEHNAVVRPLYNLKEKLGINIKIIPFDKRTWNVNEEELEDMFSYDTPKAVFLSQVSNVTGFELPYEIIFNLSKKFESINVLDSAQSFGVHNPDIKNCDFCVFAGHKTLYATFGIAGFIINTQYKLNITKSGGNGSDSLNHNMPDDDYRRYECGSANSVAIYGLDVSCDWVKSHDIYNEEYKLTQYLISELSKIPSIILYLPENKNINSIVSINLDSYFPDEVANILNEEYDIKVRSGYHCSPFVHEFIGSDKFKGTVRISIGAFTSKNDIDKLIEALKTF